MKLIRLKKFQVYLCVLICLLGIIVTSVCITVFLKDKAILTSLNSTSPYLYTHENAQEEFEAYKKHVIEEYTDKKVLALTFDDGPR